MKRKGDREAHRVVLPGGREIEMTSPLGGSPDAQRKPLAPAELHVCPECTSELVNPTDWEPIGRDRWRVDLRCPECEWLGAGVHDQATMDRFDEALDQGTEALLDDLNHLSRAIFEEEVERFVDALQRDLIQPEDF